MDATTARKFMFAEKRLDALEKTMQENAKMLTELESNVKFIKDSLETLLNRGFKNVQRNQG